MTQNLTENHYVRGADGRLYALVEGTYQRAGTADSISNEGEPEVRASFGVQEDSLSARVMIDPGNLSARVMVEPGELTAV